ncbi:MAG TPA: LamG-like jellyroll fold domain-containing protein, partial [Pirellulales bacterium]|nr:LamG-like jellyroll fold domain-containing protein [Pirellulales bacterium]
MKKLKAADRHAWRRSSGNGVNAICLFAFEALETRALLSVNVLTWHNDNTRQGLNSNEVILSPANVNSSQFGELFSYPVSGQVYAQPLYVSNLVIPGRGTLNVVFVATMTNDVYAFNADDNSGAGEGLLWHVNLGTPAAVPSPYIGNRYGPDHDTTPYVGITSTPVIDLSTDTMYIDAFTNDVVGQDVYSHHIHALDITTGADKVTPMLVTASVHGNGVGGNGTTVPFQADKELQRVALTLLNGVVYAGYGAFADTDPYHGWILGFNASTLQLVSVFNTTPNLDTDTNAGESGLWQSGAGLASDGVQLYTISGNGDFNATVGDYGDSFIAIMPDNSTSADPNINGYGLDATDYFAPFNEQALADADADLGSGGPLIVPTQSGPNPDEIIGAGKQGIIYVVNRDNMGQHSASTDNVIQEVSLGHGEWGSPAYFNSSVYYHAVGDVLKRFTLTNGLLSAAPAAQSTVVYNTQGGTPSISANGTTNGIAWDVQWDASHQVLHAYDATTLTELYNSNQNAARDQMGAGVKFITPTIADGKVFVGSSGALTIYGLLVPVTTPPLAPTALMASGITSSRVNLTWVDNSNNESGFKIERSTDGVNFSQVALMGANLTSYTDTTAIANTQYYYRVRSTNIIGDSDYSNIANTTTPPTAGAIDFYHLDTGTGALVLDSAGSNNGTLIGSTLPQWVTPGESGAAALSFSGNGAYNSATSQSAVQLASNLANVLGTTSTLDVWIKTTQVGSELHYAAPAITGADETGSANDIDWGVLDATGRIGLYVGDSGGVFSTDPVNDGQWHNIAMTRDATTGILQLYIDGVLNATGTSNSGAKTAPFKLIGALSDVAADGVTFTGGNYFNGQLDELSIYNQVLGPNDIAGISRAPNAPTLLTATAETGPVAHLTFTSPSTYALNLEIDRKTGVNGTYTPLVTLSASATMYDDTTVQTGTSYYYIVKAIDAAGTSAVSNALSVTPPAPTVVARSIFYNDSSFDGENGSSNLTDLNAIATDKQALLPGETATFANYTSYSKGITGIMIDVANLVVLPRPDDFDFRVGNDNDPDNWAMAPTPYLINTYPGRGPGGSTQITVVWNDNVLQNEWLKVTLLAQPHLGLLADDTFYFGNAIGDTGDSTADAQVTVNDVARVNANNTTSASVVNIYDINRDGVVNSQDAAIVNNNQTTAASSLQLISLAGTIPTVTTPASAVPNPVNSTT